MRLLLALNFCLLALLSGCGSRNPVDSAANPRADSGALIGLRPYAEPTPRLSISVQWTDTTAEAGIHFQHNNGAFGLKLMPETMGSGCAFFDYNSDGWPDIFLVNGRDWTQAEVQSYENGSGREHATKQGFVFPARQAHGRSTGALYRNNGNGTFSDVTRGSGLEIEMQGMGVAAGDYDNDGRCDLYITSVGRNYLFRNQSQSGAAGRVQFVEVGEKAGVSDGGWSTSAAWVDYDKDGRLDLFVCHYLDWSPAIETWHASDYKRAPNVKSYAGPQDYQGQPNRLFHNLGEGQFADVSARAGIQTTTSSSGVINRKMFGLNPKEARRLGIPPVQRGILKAKALGVAITDSDNDGWPDIMVANDTEPTFLYHNNRNGTFSDVAAKAGLALSEAARARGGMGIDSADIDQSGRESVVIGYYADEPVGLYQNQGDTIFEDKAAYAELERPGTKFVIFGAVFIDINNDSWPDILTVNGHVLDDIHKARKDLTYAQRPLLFLNRQRKDLKFDEIGQRSGSAMARPLVARGLACADYDQDGDVDVLITTNGGPAYLLRNDGGNKNNAIRLVLQGATSNRSGIGAKVQIRAGQMNLLRHVRSGSSYLSQSELPLTVGLGQESRIQSLVITWPSGRKTQLSNLPINSSFFINESKGLVRRQALRNRRDSRVKR